jgi:hypothetical protein
MTKSVGFRRMVVVASALILNGLVSASPQTSSVTPEKLGQLEITVSKVEQFSMVGDRFDGGPVSYSLAGRVYLRLKNIGDFPVCASLVPSVEEYKGAQWQYTQTIKTGFAYNPKIEKLRPGAETMGYYDFRPSPQKRDYVLVLQQLAAMQDCGETSESKNAPTSDAPSVRFSLSRNTKQR